MVREWVRWSLSLVTNSVIIYFTDYLIKELPVISAGFSIKKFMQKEIKIFKKCALFVNTMK